MGQDLKLPALPEYKSSPSPEFEAESGGKKRLKIGCFQPVTSRLPPPMTRTF